jgi:hypothetical protein
MPDKRYRMLNLRQPGHASFYAHIMDRYQQRTTPLQHYSLAKFAMLYEMDYSNSNNFTNEDHDDQDEDIMEAEEDNNHTQATLPPRIYLRDGKHSCMKLRSRPDINQC